MDERDEIEAFRRLKPETITLSAENWELFTATLDNPPEPTEAAIKAMRAFLAADRDETAPE